MSGIINVKVNRNADLRRFVITEVSLPLLDSKLRSLFSIPQETSFGLFYADDEGDFITIASEDELKHAVDLSRGLLRLELADKGPSGEVVFSKRGEFVMRGKGRGGRGRLPYDTEHRGKWRARECREEKMDHKEKERNDCKKDKFVARHVKDVTIKDGASFLPGVSFVKTWKVRNEGLDWPQDCRLMFVSRKGGDIMGAPDSVPVEGKVLSGSEVDVSVPMVAPAEPGKYVGYWRFVDPSGKKFGQRLMVSIVVGSSSSSSEEERKPANLVLDDLVKQVQGLGFNDKPAKIERLLSKHGGDVDTVAALLKKRHSGGRH